jgi:HPt (histidine-containing phosphotransfer) domain-containing protein
MESRRTQKAPRRGRHFALQEPFAAGRGPHMGNRDDSQTIAVEHAKIVKDGDTGFSGTALAGLSDKLASELFARLLLELPEHRRDLQSAYRGGNSEYLERCAHKLLGAVVYCELPKLAAALRELKQMTVAEDAAQAKLAFGKVMQLIDDLLACSGYHVR